MYSEYDTGMENYIHVADTLQYMCLIYKTQVHLYKYDSFCRQRIYMYVYSVNGMHYYT